MAPMTRGQSPDNIPSPEVANYYQRRADGGTGLIITECTFINHPTANGFYNAPAFHGSEAMSGWQRVVNKVHQSGGKIIPQLWHAGPSRSLEKTLNESALSSGPVDIFEHGKQIVKGLSSSDIQEIVLAFSEAAANAKRLGFDGVEIHGAHSYLIDQFLWHRSNKRNDKYGGSLNNRVRLACEIIKSIRAVVGSNFPILFRFSQWKLSDYDARIANTPYELEQIVLPLVEAGVDIFHVSTRRFWQPAFSNSKLSLAGWTKQITGKPVIAVGSIGIDTQFSLDILSKNRLSEPKSVELVEKKLSNGEFDLVAVGRALLADPNWPTKIESGQLNRVTPFSSELLSTLY
jgi:2,4-dienoyl-CoA reductase-like NADH-dependent reductase (Old Yellow Enzyme family)